MSKAFWKKKDAERYESRRAMIISHLGGRCAQCGAADGLEIDHADRHSKAFDISKKLKSMKLSLLMEEVTKCQLLCETCHAQKSIRERGLTPRKGVHGTLVMYVNHKCRCELCRAANAEYCRGYKRKKFGYKEKPRTGMVHGTTNAYRYYKCRCDLCRAANAEMSRRRGAGRAAHAPAFQAGQSGSTPEHHSTCAPSSIG